MSKEIELSLGSGSINAALKALNEWKREVREKADKICEQTADYAVNLATAYYEGYEGPEIYGGPPGVEKQEYHDGHGYHVYASGNELYPVGNSVMFYEFGSGTAAGQGNPIAAKVGANPGTWSRDYGTGEFYNTGEWQYSETPDGDPIIYRYINGTNAMYQASQDAKERLHELVQREFG